MGFIGRLRNSGVYFLVLKKCKKPDDVLFINASEYFEKGNRQNKLAPEHIEKIVTTYQFRKVEERHSRRVGMEEIDLSEINQTLMNLEEKIDSYTKTHNDFLKELGLSLLPKQ